MNCGRYLSVVALMILCTGILTGCDLGPRTESTPDEHAARPYSDTVPYEERTSIGSSSAAIQSAFESRRRNMQVQGDGVVYKILSDDLEGSRHQRFLLRTDTGLSLLIAHNIDLAPRINGIRVGDTVSFYGVYEYNDKGGVVHWTHHDPGGRHVGGWLKHGGSIYQ